MKLQPVSRARTDALYWEVTMQWKIFISLTRASWQSESAVFLAVRAAEDHLIFRSDTVEDLVGVTQRRFYGLAKIVHHL